MTVDQLGNAGKGAQPVVQIREIGLAEFLN
jgi:hypothetical protein